MKIILHEQAPIEAVFKIFFSHCGLTTRQDGYSELKGWWKDSGYPKVLLSLTGVISDTRRRALSLHVL